MNDELLNLINDWKSSGLPKEQLIEMYKETCSFIHYEIMQSQELYHYYMSMGDRKSAKACKKMEKSDLQRLFKLQDELNILRRNYYESMDAY